MIRSKTRLFSIIVIIFISLLGCQQKASKSELASLDLLRGELLLCGNPQFGEVRFSSDCEIESRETFDLALSLLHSFEYDEAEKAFVKVIDADPECAMAYWGVAMTIYHQLWAPPVQKDLEKGAKLLEIAQNQPKSKRANQYLNAISVYFKDWETKDHHSRELLYQKKMEQLYLNSKEDTEAAIFYALSLTSSADPKDKTYINQKKAGKILEALFKEQPEHPGIAHYIIHTYDYPEIANLGLETARRYAQIAPSSAHAQHMPSHIFTRRGLWEESIATNINSAASAVCYAESMNEKGNWSQEIHAMDYMVYAYLQLGDNENVDKQLAYLKSIKTIFPENNFAVAYSINSIPARIALESRNWTEAGNLELPAMKLQWDKFPWERSITHFAKALGAARSNNIKVAEIELQTLRGFKKQLLAMGSGEDLYKAGQVEIEIKATEAWIALAKGNKNEALTAMKIAAKLESETSKHPVTPGEVLPADELLADLYLELQMPQEALKAYEINLVAHPNRFNGIYGAAIAAKQVGDKEKAKIYFNQLLELTKNINSNRIELLEAKTYVEENII